jgi:hypothetical protein
MEMGYGYDAPIRVQSRREASQGGVTRRKPVQETGQSVGDIWDLAIGSSGGHRAIEVILCQGKSADELRRNLTAEVPDACRKVDKREKGF